MIKCQGCNQQKILTNKFYKLCSICNNKRLQSNKKNKTSNLLVRNLNSSTSDENRIKRKVSNSSIKKAVKNFDRTINKIKKDDDFYKLCFDKSNHKCEECNETLPDQFLNDQGRVLARWRYSHIIPKSIAPHLRHNVDNINHLCLTCHSKWDFGNKKTMKIYKKNSKKFPEFF